MDYEFRTVDVFTDVRFGGNQLAVLPDATGLDTQAMQNIAIEFNYSETTFVLPAQDSANTCQVRIFTPGGEMPFAGHPNVGTAHVLAVMGRLGASDSPVLNAKFEEQAGIVDIRVAVMNGTATVEVRAPRGLDKETPLDPTQAAEMIGISAQDLGEFSPRYAESGVGFLLVEVADADVLARTSANVDVFKQLSQDYPTTGVYAFTRSGVGVGNDIRARMYAPLEGIAEDPATGSAACVLAGALAHERGEDGKYQYLIEQGIEMGRPSHLSARATIANGDVDVIHLYGQCVDVMRGTLTV